MYGGVAKTFKEKFRHFSLHAKCNYKEISAAGKLDQTRQVAGVDRTALMQRREYNGVCADRVVLLDRAGNPVIKFEVVAGQHHGDLLDRRAAQTRLLHKRAHFRVHCAPLYTKAKMCTSPG